MRRTLASIHNELIAEQREARPGHLDCRPLAAEAERSRRRGLSRRCKSLGQHQRGIGFFDHVRADIRNYLVVRFFTGMRTGEIHGLKWKYLDFECRQMGHSTTEMLFRVYSRYVPNLTRQDGSAFEAILRRASSNQMLTKSN